MPNNVKNYILYLFAQSVTLVEKFVVNNNEVWLFFPKISSHHLNALQNIHVHKFVK